jgi:Asp-tRNA(Asn)/Glu-tRNA(Gln) amidotransferase A subunit family amidase
LVTGYDLLTVSEMTVRDLGFSVERPFRLPTAASTSYQNSQPIGLQAIGPYLEDLTPIRFAALLAREIGGFTKPDGFGA